MKWDTSSGVRERLALLAEFGPSLVEHWWGYHPSRDFWYFCGPGGKGISTATRCEVRQEGTASLSIISARWGLDREGALARIGGEA